MATKKKAVQADEPEKKKRKKRPAYKPESMQATFDDVDSAFSDLESLRDECREIVENASEGLAQTQRIQTFESTADTMDNLSQPTVPECLNGFGFSYAIMVNTNKRSGPSRSVRCSNILAVFSGAAEEARELLETHKARRGTDEAEENDIKEDDEGDVETFADECEEIVNDCDSLEFPGMFG